MHRQRVLRGAVGEKAGHTGRIKLVRHEPRGTEGADFAREEQAMRRMRHVERLDADWIAGEEYASVSGLVKGEREHPVDHAESFVAPAGKRLEQDLRIARARDRDAFRLEFRSEPTIVVDLPVERQAVARHGMNHWLMSGHREVEDRQPAESERGDHAAFATAHRHPFEALVVRPAMRHGPHHLMDRRFQNFRVRSDRAADSAHRWLSGLDGRLITGLAPRPCGSRRGRRNPL